MRFQPPSSHSPSLFDGATPAVTEPTLRGSRFDIVFDGGALGNPGKGYGSYEITDGDRAVRRTREEFGDRVTNNQAEYLTLIRALEWLAQALGPAARDANVVVNGDSQLVLYQLLGRWKVKNAGLRDLHARASRLLTGFASVDLAWHPRARSVERLGH